MAKGQLFHELPPWAKGVVAVAVIGGGAFIAYKLYKGAKSIKEQKGAREEQAATKDELSSLNRNAATKQTITATQASAIANALFTAMDGYGTDTAAIMKQLSQIKNQADWLAVQDAFGIREISSGKLNPEPNFKGTLTGAFTSELGVTDTAMQNIVNAYFKSKGIKAVI